MPVGLASAIVKRGLPVSGPIKLRIIEAAGRTKMIAPEGRVWRVAIIKAGTSLNKRNYEAPVLKRAAPLFENAKAYAFEFKRPDGTVVFDHLPDEVTNAVPQEYFSQNEVGFFKNVKFQEYVDLDGSRQRGLTADFYCTDDRLRKKLLNAYEAGRRDLLGFSINADGSAEPVLLENGDGAVDVKEISKVTSVDVVTTPAAGGQIQRLVASLKAREQQERTTMKDLIFTIVARLFPDIIGGNLKESSSDAQVLGWLTAAGQREGLYQTELKESMDRIRTQDMKGAWDVLADLARLVEGKKKEGDKPGDEEEPDGDELYTEMKHKMEEAGTTGEAFKERYGIGKEAAKRMASDLEGMDEAKFKEKYGMAKGVARSAMISKEGVKAGLVKQGIEESVADQWEILGIPSLRSKVPKDPGNLDDVSGPEGSKGNDPSPAGKFSQPTQPKGQRQTGLEPKGDLSEYRAVESFLNDLKKERADFARERGEFARERQSLVLDRMLQESGLPQIATDRIKESLVAVVGLKESAIKTRIDSERRYLAALSPTGQVRGMGGFTKDTDAHIQTGADRSRFLEAAMDGLMFGDDSCTCRQWNQTGSDLLPCRQHEKVPAFTGLQEAWYQIEGRPMEDAHEVLFKSAMWIPGRVKKWQVGTALKEALNASSWTRILGDSITRRLIAAYNLHGLSDWRKWVSDITPIKDFRTNRRMRLGGYGTLPAVAESATYQNLPSPADEEATYAISKRGGLERLTLEMVANDDVGAIRRIPVSLGRAAGQTIYRFVLDFLLQNQLVYDGLALAVAGHNNLDTGVLSSGALTTAKRRMMQQTAFGNATEFLGEANLPKYLVVPLELEETALILTTAPTQVGLVAADRFSTNPNLHSRYGMEYMTVPYWSVDTPAAANRWGLVANPRNVPTIELGFFNGNQDPELFVQDAPNIGSVFTADSITYKIRHIYGGVVLDFRGFYLSIP